MSKPKKKRDFKHWVGKAHLVLGLASGLIVLLLGITGCIFVFNQEITDALRKDAIYVKEVKGTAIPVSHLWKQAQAQLGDSLTITNVTVYNDPKQSVVFHCYKFGGENLWYYDNIDQYVSVYTDQYTGKVIKVYDEELDFFVFIKALH